MARYPRKKPTGLSGPTRLTVGPDVVSRERQLVEFPAEKAKIEEMIAQAFMRDVKSHPSAAKWYGPITQNGENDYDFDVDSPDGPRKLELMEIVLQPHSTLGPEEHVVFMTGERASFIHEQIETKSRHYASAKPSRIILLMYITEGRFMLGHKVEEIVSYLAATRPHVFEYIYSYRVVSADEGEVELIYPVERSWDGFDPEKAANWEEVNLSLMGMRLSVGPGRAILSHPLPRVRKP